jgi:NAD dependent epimerase/dehydratase family enzyme
MSNPVGPSRLLTLDGAIDSGQLAGIDACVNLAGVGVGNHSWTEGYKALIRSSRVPGTRALAGVLAGTQAWSWISLSDEVAATRFLLGRPDLRGPVNLTAPGPVTNAAFTAALDHALHRPDLPWLRAPAWLLRAALGESIGDVLINAQAPATGSAARRCHALSAELAR